MISVKKFAALVKKANRAVGKPDQDEQIESINARLRPAGCELFVENGETWIRVIRVDETR